MIRLLWTPPRHLPWALLLAVALLAPNCERSNDHWLSVSPPLVWPLTTPRIAFLSRQTGFIYLYDPQTGHSTQLSPSGAYDPVISPDGTRIAFASGGVFGPGLQTMAVDGSDRQTYTVDDSSGSDHGPHWSPNGAYLAFTRSEFKTISTDVYTIRADGTHLSRVTTDGRSVALDWSPDGTRLLLARSNFTSLVTVTPGGSDPSVLLQDSTAAFMGADYSADGTRIVISRDNPADLETVNADGSNRQRLQGSEGFYYVGHSSWSPDGQSVAFSAIQAYSGGLSPMQIFTLGVGSAVPQPIVTGTTDDDFPDWGPKR